MEVQELIDKSKHESLPKQTSEAFSSSVSNPEQDIQGISLIPCQSASKEPSVPNHVDEQSLLKEIKQLKKTVAVQGRVIKQLRKKKYIPKLQKENLIRSELTKYFTESQTKHLMTGKRVHWGEEDIIKGLILYATSKKAYRLIKRQKLIPLPSISSLKKWVTNFDCNPGVLYQVIAVLKRDIGQSANSKTRIATLSFDEMEIKKKFEYFQKNDQVLPPSKKVQVVMLRGLCANWKQPVFYNFDCPMTPEILLDIILKVEEAGIQIVAITCDGGATNQGLLKSLGVSTDRTHFLNPFDSSRKVYAFYDVPHLLKLIRNHIIDEGIFIDGKGTKLCREDFMEILAHDRGEFKIHHKLTPLHITCSGIQRQRVRLAAELLSHRSACAILSLNHSKEAQANTVELVNNWFDVLNSRTKFSKTKLACAYGVHLEEQSAILREMLSAVRNWKCDSNRKIAPFQRGILISTQSLINLFQELKEKHDIEFVMTSHLNQDCLENLFSQIRALGGPYSHPTSAEFINRLRTLLIGKSADLVVQTAAVQMTNENSPATSESLGYKSTSSGNSVSLIDFKLINDDYHDLSVPNGFASQKIISKVQPLPLEV